MTTQQRIPALPTLPTLIVFLLVGMVPMIHPGWAVSAVPEKSSAQELPTVPPEEYPIFDQVLLKKFLTSKTTLVIIQRQTSD